MERIILVTGGARSGKSSFAESIYEGIESVVYIATSIASDSEMVERIKLHRQSRPSIWETFEGYREIHKAVNDKKHYLLDCLTVLTSNIMFEISQDAERISVEMQREIEEEVMKEIGRLIENVKENNGNLVIVTNEVGDSIVPENHIARVYRDVIGRINQRTARLCSEVYLVTCGIPMRLK